MENLPVGIRQRAAVLFDFKKVPLCGRRGEPCDVLAEMGNGFLDVWEYPLLANDVYD